MGRVWAGSGRRCGRDAAEACVAEPRVTGGLTPAASTRAGIEQGDASLRRCQGRGRGWPGCECGAPGRCHGGQGVSVVRLGAAMVARGVGVVPGRCHGGQGVGVVRLGAAMRYRLMNAPSVGASGLDATHPCATASAPTLPHFHTSRLMNAPSVGASGLDATHPCAAGLMGSSPPVHRKTTGPAGSAASGASSDRATSSITATCARAPAEMGGTQGCGRVDADRGRRVPHRDQAQGRDLQHHGNLRARARGL
eukprot:361264-Chlamydomonas_euryale.AAC.6